MRMIDLIIKKKSGLELTEDEIKFIVDGYTVGTIPDYQMSAFLMAVYFKKFSKVETSNFTMAMANSGETVDLSELEGIKVDKHSTGGVGDKTTLIISPIVASCGVPVAKLSGRGLGHTGGTVDKLEAIPNLKTEFTKEEFIKIVDSVGVCVSGQSGNLAPADKKIYALRDVTATVDNISLIAASIMSKKIAAGSDAILLDVKTGSGAFMKTIDESIELAKEMVDIGESVGRNMAALVTNMDVPLGYAIGNALEIKEVVETLKGNGPKDLTDVCLELAKNMLYLANKGSLKECESMVKSAIDSGKALEKFAEMVEAQGGKREYIENTSLFEKAKIEYSFKSEKSGYISKMDTEGCGMASCLLGAGREKTDSIIDNSAGIILKKKVGDYVEQGETLAIFYTSSDELLQSSIDRFSKVILFSDEKPQAEKLIYARVDKNGVIFESVI